LLFNGDISNVYRSGEGVVKGKWEVAG